MAGGASSGTRLYRCTGPVVQGTLLGSWLPGFRVQGWGLGFRVHGFQGLGFRVQGFGFRGWGS